MSDCDNCDSDDCENCIETSAEDVKSESEKPPVMASLVLNLDEIQTDVAAILVKQMNRTIRERIEEKTAKQVAALVEKCVDEATLEHIRQAVDAIVVEGWRKTDDYGTPVGERLTIRDRVESILKAKGSYDRQSRVDALIEKHVDKVLEKDLAEQMRQVRSSFHAKVEAHICGVLTEELRRTIESSLRGSIAQVLKAQDKA